MLRSKSAIKTKNFHKVYKYVCSNGVKSMGVVSVLEYSLSFLNVDLVTKQLMIHHETSHTVVDQRLSRGMSVSAAETESQRSSLREFSSTIGDTKFVVHVRVSFTASHTLSLNILFNSRIKVIMDYGVALRMEQAVRLRAVLPAASAAELTEAPMRCDLTPK